MMVFFTASYDGLTIGNFFCEFFGRFGDFFVRKIKATGGCYDDGGGGGGEPLVAEIFSLWNQ